MDKMPEQEEEIINDPQVHIKNITFDIKKKDVYRKLDRYGQILKIVMQGTECFVLFADHKCAQKLIQE